MPLAKVYAKSVTGTSLNAKMNVDSLTRPSKSPIIAFLEQVYDPGLYGKVDPASITVVEIVAKVRPPRP